MNLQDNFKDVTKGAIKGLLSGIPCIGGVAIGAWDGFYAARSQDFINKLSERLNKLDEKKVDASYIQSEEFCDLFMKSLRSITFHRSKIKARFILGLVIESATNDRDRSISVSLKESFLNILDQLSDEEMNLLHEISAGKYSLMSKDQFYEKAMGVEIDGLMAKGIVASGYDQRIKATALGEKFIAYMRILAKESI